MPKKADKLKAAMVEVHKNPPSTVKPGMSKKKTEKQLQAIAYSKAGQSKKGKK